jgi:CBS domain-containing protein
MTTAYAQRSHESASLASVRVAEAMHRGVVTCKPDTTLHTVARVMAAHRIHAVVVAPEAEAATVWALVSDLDLAAAVSNGSLEAATAGEIASMPSLSVAEEETVARAAQLMCECETHHLIVLGRDSRRPVGIVSTLDIADVVAELAQPRTVDAAGTGR